MIVLALIGSPRKQGNCDILTDEVLRGAQEAGAAIEKAYLDDLNIRPIGEVADVAAERTDPRDDDDLPALLARFLEADVVVFASPVYWQGVSAQTKCFIDRLSSYFRRPPYAQRFDGKGYVVVCTFGRREKETAEWVTGPMKITTEVLRGRYLGECCVSVYEKGRVAGMPEALKEAFELGRGAVKQMRGYMQSEQT
jgi:multimeric flavodoxin WrbA